MFKVEPLAKDESTHLITHFFNLIILFFLEIHMVIKVCQFLLEGQYA
jgi:hypothetical protein